MSATTTCKDCKPTVPPFVNWDDAPVRVCPLHAAAPAMLAALEHILSDEYPTHEAIEEARAAIAQARGDRS